MGIFDWIPGVGKSKTYTAPDTTAEATPDVVTDQPPQHVKPQPGDTDPMRRDVAQAYYGYSSFGGAGYYNTTSGSGWTNAWVQVFDGEKNAGEIGPVTSYILNYYALGYRSWEVYLTSEIARTVLNRFNTWILDKGLKLQCSPAKKVLESEGITMDPEPFNSLVEARFGVYAKSKRASHNGMQSLNELAKEAYKNCKIGGDVLVVLRFKNDVTTVELIDGSHIRTPYNKIIPDPKGNRIVDGVEIDKNGRHVKYYVSCLEVDNKTYEEIPAWSPSTGLRTAFLVYGSKYRLNETRGVPAIATSLETISKIDRYKEAAVGSAEERQKIVYAIEHNQISDGSSPLKDQIVSAVNPDYSPIAPTDSYGSELANTIAATTNKATYNMTPGSKLTSLESKNEMFFKEFYETNADIICGAIGIPPNVAFSIYNDSFSASRAATKDWEHTMDVERDEFKCQFYDPIYAYWLHTEILGFKIQAPGYLSAFGQGNYMVVESYLNCRFTGPMFPHIDPLKEAKAEREKLGPLAAHLPLTTMESATETLSGSEYSSNVQQFAKELEAASDVDVEPVPQPTPGTPQPDPDPDGDED